MAAFPLSDPQDPHSLRFVSSARGLVLRGACDLAGVDRLTAALRWQEHRRAPFDVDLSRVSFADTTGLTPFADSVRRCRAAGAPEPALVAASGAVRRVFDTLGVALRPFDLLAWDAADLPVVRDSGPAWTDGGDRRRPRGTGSVTPVCGPVTCFVRTVEHDAGSATVRVAGVLDEDAAVVVCELLLGHQRAGRNRIAVDVTPVARSAAGAMSLLVRTAQDMSAQVTLSIEPT